MKLYARLVVALGFPIAAACTLSLPLILLGAVAPDPRPWNWPTVYIVDFLYGLAQPAPITAKWFIFIFMSAGLILGALMLLLAFRHGRYWTAFSLSQER